MLSSATVTFTDFVQAQFEISQGNRARVFLTAVPGSAADGAFGNDYRVRARQATGSDVGITQDVNNNGFARFTIDADWEGGDLTELDVVNLWNGNEAASALFNATQGNGNQRDFNEVPDDPKVTPGSQDINVAAVFAGPMATIDEGDARIFENTNLDGPFGSIITDDFDTVTPSTVPAAGATDFAFVKDDVKDSDEIPTTTFNQFGFPASTVNTIGGIPNFTTIGVPITFG